MKTNKELAFEMCDCVACKNFAACQGVNNTCGAFHAVMRMAEYKDEQAKAEKKQWLNKADDWLWENLYDVPHGNSSYITSDKESVSVFVKDFLWSMD